MYQVKIYLSLILANHALYTGQKSGEDGLRPLPRMQWGLRWGLTIYLASLAWFHLCFEFSIKSWPPHHTPGQRFHSRYPWMAIVKHLDYWCPSRWRYHYTTSPKVDGCGRRWCTRAGGGAAGGTLWCGYASARQSYYKVRQARVARWAHTTHSIINEAGYYPVTLDSQKVHTQFGDSSVPSGSWWDKKKHQV